MRCYLLTISGILQHSWRPYAASVTIHRHDMKAPAGCRRFDCLGAQGHLAALRTHVPSACVTDSAVAMQALLIAAYYSSKIVDDYVAAGQRKDLGLCTMCGGVYDATDCPKEKCPCKAVPPPAP